MPPFVPEDHFEACLSASHDSHHTASLPQIIDPFVDDFVLAWGKSETTNECTHRINEIVPMTINRDMRSVALKVDCTAEAASIGPQVPNEVAQAGLQDSSMPESISPTQPGEVDTKHNMNDEGMDTSRSKVSGNPSLKLRAPAGVCTITAEVARKIFTAKTKRRKNDGLASRLGEEFRISAKAVRDIWRLRTWAHATRPFWTPEDVRKYFKK